MAHLIINLAKSTTTESRSTNITGYHDRTLLSWDNSKLCEIPLLNIFDFDLLKMIELSTKRIWPLNRSII